VLLAGETAGLSIHEFPPAEVKKAIAGTGSATKEQVQFMLTRLLRLRAAPEPADASDGVAAAVTFMLTAHIAALTAHQNGGGHHSGAHRSSGAPAARRIK
jgi:crossover junction endodeoxyribonuclease RuvC